MINNQKKNNELLITFLLGFYTVWKISTFVGLYANTYLAMVILFAISLRLIGGIQSFSNKSAVFATANVYLLIVAFDRLESSRNIAYAAWAIYLEYFAFLLGSLMLFYKMDHQIKVIVPLLLATYAITCLTTYIGLQVFPKASRELATGSVDYAPYYARNIGGFNFIYSLIVLHPMFVCVLRVRRRLILALLMTVLIGLCIAESKYTTAALTFVISCIAYMIPVRQNKRFSLRIWMMVPIMAIGYWMAPDILRWLAEQEELMASAEKLKDIAAIMEGEKASIENTKNRQLAYRTSWRAFLSSPIFGTRIFGKKVSGGHSFILDMMAQWGIFGLGAITFIIRRIYVFLKEIATNAGVFWFAVVSLTLSVLLAGLNSRFWVFELGFAMPLMIRYVGIIREQEQLENCEIG